MGQLYGKEQIGKTKVEALHSVVTSLCGENKLTTCFEEVKPSEGNWLDYVRFSAVVCTTFDSIKARKIVYERWKDYGVEGSLFIDGRMSIENGQVFTLIKSKTTDYKFYEGTFFNDDEIPEAPCTLKATSHCGALIASLMTSQITNYMTNLDKTNMERTLVRQLDFNLPLSSYEQSTHN